MRHDQIAREWDTRPLEDCMAAIIDYRGKTPRKTQSGIPLVTAKIVKCGRIELPDEFIDQADYDKWMRRGLPLPGDVVITTEAPLGEVAQLDGRKVALAQRLICLRGQPNILDNTFLKFLMQSPFVQEQLRARATGTTVMGIRQSDLRRVLLPVPGLHEQRAIANILGALDDKIELNSRTNETLEVVARALFKSWFVDFDPVRAKMAGRPPAVMDAATAALFPDAIETDLPRGWRHGSLNDIAHMNAWTLGASDDLDEIEYVEISDVVRGRLLDTTTYSRGTEPSRARRRLRHGDTVISTVRPERASYFLCLHPGANLVGSTGFAVLTPHRVPWTFLYCAATYPVNFEVLGRLADGGAYPAVRPEAVAALALPLPNHPALLTAFDEQVAIMFETCRSNSSQSKTLATIRDLLLPKLLSGELRIRDAEHEVEKVA